MKVSLKALSILLIIISSLPNNSATAQIAINSDGATPDASAMLDITSTNKGILIPRMDSTNRKNISNPAEGLMVYDSTTNSFWFYANATWNNLNSTFIIDTDGDTKIVVEQNTDDDSIRFYTSGTEYFSMHDGRLSVANTGNSVFIGDSAGINDDLSANYNSFVGYISGKSNTTGYYNSFYGANTGYSNTTGHSNTFAGTSSGALNTTGANNTFYGARSGSMNTTGSANVFLGRTAGFINTTGSDNVFIGYSTGFSNETGNNNTLIGREAGFSNTTGNSNIFLGYQAGYAETGSNKLYIDNSDTTAPLIYGEFDNDLVKINGQFSVSGGLTDDDNDTKIQVEESTDDDIIRFDMNGTEFMRLDSGRIEIVNTGQSVFIGEGAGENDDFTTNNNSYIGYQAGQNITSGNSNTAVGSQAGKDNETGSYNTYLGTKAGDGSHSNSSYNTYLGADAGLDNGGDNNVFVGYKAGDFSDGSNNVFLGTYAGADQTVYHRLFIDNTNTNSPLIYGEFDNDLVKINGQFNVTDTVTLSSALIVNGQDLANTAFTSDNGIIHTINNDDDFIIGADSLNHGSGSETKLFFDKSKGALRAGRINGTKWDDSNVGDYSTAFGYNSQASGNYSMAFGGLNSATGNFATVWGDGTIATGGYSTAWGGYNDANGDFSTALGYFNQAQSFAETVIGMYSTTYTANDASNYDSDDRLFVIGNGTGSSNRSNAMIVYKNGNTEINGQLSISDTVNLSSALMANGKDLTNTAFTTENGLTYTNNSSDDFVVGGDNLDYGGSGHESKMFFDKGQFAFRTGRTNNTNWDNANLGLYSFATGTNTLATGNNSAAFGYQSLASGTHSFAGGNSSEATGAIAFTFGREVYAPSYGEVALGLYGTSYTPNETSAFDTDDRLFSIGNGTADNSRSDAMVIYKNGNTEINGALTLSNAFTFPTTDGSANQILTTDGSGTLSWSEANLISDDDGDTKILAEQSSDDDIIRFYTEGTEYLRLSDGRLSVKNTGGDIFIGDNAGVSVGATNHYNTVIGDNALNDYTTSSLHNTAIGTNAGRGSNGQIADGNVFIGYNSGRSSDVSSRNVIVGYQAGYAATVSANNALIGSSSGSSVTTGSQNVMLGTNTGVGVTTGSGNVFLGNNAGGTSDVSNELFIDNSPSDSPLIWGDFTDNDVVINGYLGVNTTPTNARLQVDGTLGSETFSNDYAMTSSAVGSYSGTANLSIYANNNIAAKAFIAHSDRRIKNIKGISNGKKDLEILNSIEITDYTMIDTIQEGTKPFKKVIAQQVAEVFPQAITKGLTEVVPDIYQRAIVDENGWINLNTNLTIGEEVKIIFDDREEILEILEVNENAFRVEQLATGNSQPSTAFIYGRQVTDFHTVDYEAISMLNVSATQQLAKENQALKNKVEQQSSEIKVLKNEVSKIQNLERQNAEMKAMLKQIQAQLISNQ